MILEVGKKYKVSFEDCCVSGWFTSVLIGIEYNEDGKEYSPNITNWDNGVHLEEQWGVTFEEV